MSEEVGRELTAEELRPSTVVWISAEHRPEKLSVWVKHITPRFIHFWAGKTRVEFMAIRTPDGLEDELHRAIRVFEYLGEV